MKKNDYKKRVGEWKREREREKGNQYCFGSHIYILRVQLRLNSELQIQQLHNKKKLKYKLCFKIIDVIMQPLTTRESSSHDRTQTNKAKTLTKTNNNNKIYNNK